MLPVEDIGAFYFTIANLDPRYKSRLGFIHPLALFKYTSAGAFDAALKKVVAMFKEFQSSVNPNFDVKLLTFIGDTPASAAVSGFKCSMSAYRPCRYCHSLWQDLANLSSPTLRSKEEHEVLCDMLSDNETFSREFGINGKSPLLSISYFDIFKQIPFDIMHIMS